MSLCSAGQPSLGEEPRPNVLLIITDDQAWGDVHSHGNEQLHTPTLDRLAASGARFDRFFVSPFCAATRASVLTGRYHLRCGVWGETRGQESMRPQEVTIGEIFQKEKYSTGYFGKWHNGAHFPMHPNGQGFDEFLGFCGDHWNSYFDPTLERNGTSIRTTGFIADVLTDAALAFLSKNDSNPFFCCVSYNTPHSPFQVPDAYFGKYKSRGLDNLLASVYGMVENLDQNIGRLIKALDDLQLANRTIVVFMTDNGPHTERFNAGLRGQKGSLHEGGVRVPLFMRFPGKIRAGLGVRPIAAHVDLLPTLAELCGIRLASEPVLDGRSLVPLLLGQSADWPERDLVVFSGKGERGAVRNANWRAVREDRKWELYDMLHDPGETRDEAAAHPEILSGLSKTYDSLLGQILKHRLEPIPIPLGHDQAPVVDLPAHEAHLVLAGQNGIAYYGKYGLTNDWISQWTSTGAYPWWDVEIARPGNYEFALLYTCPKSDVGAKLRIEFGEQEIEGTVSQAHDPPVPKLPDRVERRETFDRDWAILTMGIMKLAAGRGKLIVRALEKTGPRIIELKGIRVRRQD